MAAIFNIEIDQGATYTLGLVYRDAENNPVDLTGCVVRMAIREDFSSPPSWRAKNGDDYITTATTDGRIDILIPPDQTAELRFRSGVYDIKIHFPNGFVKRLIQGTVKVNPSVVRGGVPNP